MGNVGQIEIRIIGNKGNNPLTPDNFDIKEIITLLSTVEPLLYPSKKVSRPTVSYRIETGSVRNLFTVTKQAEAAFAAVMTLISSSGSIDSLELPSAKAVEQFQNIAIKSNYSFEFKTSESANNLLVVSPETHYFRSDSLWADADLYFYGLLVDAGGKDKSNIHIETKNLGTLVIAADRETLKNEERNLLYKEYGVYASGKQNVVTGEIDKSTLKLIKFIDYAPSFDQRYLDSLIQRVGDKFKGIDVDEYITGIRDYYV